MWIRVSFPEGVIRYSVAGLTPIDFENQENRLLHYTIVHPFFEASPYMACVFKSELGLTPPYHRSRCEADSSVAMAGLYPII
jgi:hypothetical protein